MFFKILEYILNALFFRICTISVYQLDARSLALCARVRYLSPIYGNPLAMQNDIFTQNAIRVKFNALKATLCAQTMAAAAATAAQAAGGCVCVVVVFFPLSFLRSALNVVCVGNFCCCCLRSMELSVDYADDLLWWLLLLYPVITEFCLKERVYLISASVLAFYERSDACYCYYYYLVAIQATDLPIHPSAILSA